MKNAIKDFNNKLPQLKQKEAELEERRRKFVEDYTIECLKDLTLDEYVIGTGSKSTFCYRIERELRELGAMNVKAGTYIYGIAVDKDAYESGVTEYKIAKEYGNDPVSAFNKVKNDIVKLLEAAEKNDYNAILNSKVYSVFKYKLLFTYYPEKFQNICTKSDALAAVMALGYSVSDPDMLALYALMDEWRNKSDETKSWTNYELMVFIYDSLGLSEQKKSAAYKKAYNYKSKDDAEAQRAVADAKDNVARSRKMQAEQSAKNSQKNAELLSVGQELKHKSWGIIKVIEIMDNKVIVEKEDHEQKKITLENFFNFVEL